MNNVIDAVAEGGAPWNAFQVTYDGERPEQESPPWMSQAFEVWYRDPHQVIKQILANREFAGSFDYLPYREFLNGKRRWSDFMSGNWAWTQAVSVLFKFINELIFDCFIGYYCRR
jgi:Plavaka transposase